MPQHDYNFNNEHVDNVNPNDYNFNNDHGDNNNHDDDDETLGT